MLNPTSKIKLLNIYAIGNFIYLDLWSWLSVVAYQFHNVLAVQCRIFIMFLYGIAALWWLFSFLV